MRFLNTRTLEFEQVADSELHLEDNQYAILSHRWGANEDEVSFEDVRLSKDFSNKKGFQKLEGFRKEASSANCRYGWIDTCCINKGDSSELSEAINSMYRWYQGSKICIVYLEDVPQKQVMDSVWFDRGWTLQELISPKAVTFFDKNWKVIGTKTELIADLSRKTRIPEGILSHTTELSTCSIAQRMSWAADRVTTREEDRAYSLMGLFDLNMPMIYGEREKAFLRLQQHIIQKSKDESIFAWATEFSGNTREYSGLFAPTPLAYKSCSDIVQTQGSRGFSESNGALSIRLKIFLHSVETYGAILNCTDRAYPHCKIFILIGRTSTKDEYVRVADTKHVGKRLLDSTRWDHLQEQQIHVLENPIEPPVNIFNGFWLQTVPPSGYGKFQTTILSNSQTSELDCICPPLYTHGIPGIVQIEPSSESRWYDILEYRLISFSFDDDWNPVIAVFRRDADPYERLRKMFRQAVAGGPQSLAHQQIMENFKRIMKNFKTIKIFRTLEGPFERIDRKQGSGGQLIKKSNLEIFVQLKSIDRGGLSVSPMKVWIVEISTVRGHPLWRILSLPFDGCRKFRVVFSDRLLGFLPITTSVYH